MRGKKTQVWEQHKTPGVRTGGEGSRRLISTRTTGRSPVKWTEKQVKTAANGSYYQKSEVTSYEVCSK